ncbi:MAG TPA: arabinan endo-1,5-alpha-L-arabinosidase [Kribbellaceae bacterium]|nr:arabinan endo-1,5-alpha-L-arabinosidase [Kribbellaceae bacterium]
MHLLRRSAAVVLMAALALAAAALAGCAHAPVQDPADAPVQDPPSAALPQAVHDPTLFKDGKTFYVFSTGIRNPEHPGGIFAHRSRGSLAGPWESLGSVPLPKWTRGYDVAHLWAPHVVESDGTFYLYYAASSFGTNRSAIGMATTKTPGDLGSWVDHGPILTSKDGDDYNAIDPQVFPAGGRWYIAYGSFWTGIKLQRLAGMRTVVGPRIAVASNTTDPANPIENAQVFQHGSYWYLAASWDYCCRGVDSTYKVVVGRSTSPTGPFVDADGVPMTDGGGTILLDRRGDQIGPGALDVLDHDGRLYAVHHYYDAAAGGTIRMQIREVEGRDGWPYFSYGPGDGEPPS